MYCIGIHLRATLCNRAMEIRYINGDFGWLLMDINKEYTCVNGVFYYRGYWFLLVILI